MYNGGIFGGGPTGSLGIGVPFGWGNVDDTDVAQQVLKDRVKVTAKESDQIRRMRNRFLSWFPKANRTKFTFTNEGGSWGGKMIFPEGNRTNPNLGTLDWVVFHPNC